MKPLLFLTILLVASTPGLADTQTRAVFLTRDIINETISRLRASPTLRQNLRRRLIAALRQEDCNDSQIPVILEVDVLLEWKRQLHRRSIEDRIRSKVIDSLLLAQNEQSCDTIRRVP
jgi:hypothetical protein